MSDNIPEVLLEISNGTAPQLFSFITVLCLTGIHSGFSSNWYINHNLKALGCPNLALDSIQNHSE